MNGAIEAGTSTSPLFRQDVLRFEDRWWELGLGGAAWVEVTDGALIAGYDRDATAMTPERAEAQRRANIRAVAAMWR